MERHTSASDGPADDTAFLDEITDPAELADLPAVEHSEETFVHESEDYCEAGYAGRAIVGVVTDDGVLALVDAEEPAAVLPNGKVEPGEDYVAAGERAVEEATGVPVRIEAPVYVRTVRHRIEDEDALDETTRHVVFRATPATDNPKPAASAAADLDADVTATWLSELPEDLANAGMQSANDVARFLD
ncbi:NUDIX domain-containing protein [Halostella sp. JP-L12]|uniref:NUDIX hydrolase n=1 Tax=Halostella TaxID=1843185 RepID=UPI000EF7B8FB|nr:MULTISPECIES: NUDIX domain-containing protein [Halostella]NHN48684.1 NUDIX domain-containing protein [Halostella sp. JP-L12]